MGPALACSARQHDGAVWHGLVGLAHDECKLGNENGIALIASCLGCPVYVFSSLHREYLLGVVSL